MSEESNINLAAVIGPKQTRKKPTKAVKRIGTETETVTLTKIDKKVK